jgi:hypothetical protein
MYSELKDTEDSIYLDFLRDSAGFKALFKFENFKAYLTKSSILKINKVLSNFIQNVRYDKMSRILPILISYKQDTIFLFNMLKDGIKNCRIVYVSSPPESMDIINHVYTSLIEELGLNLLKEVSDKIQNQNLRRTRCVRVLTTYFRDKDEKEYNILDFENEVQVTENSFELLKLIGAFSNEVILLYFDDIETPYEKYGDKAERMLLESIKRLHYDVRQLIIILICSRKSWHKILRIADESFISILGPELEFYDISHLKRYITKIMDEYWLEVGVKPPINQYFPLTEKLIEGFFDQSEGDIRKFLGLYVEAIDTVISD